MEDLPGVLPVQVDLLSPDDVKRAIAPTKDVTHIVFRAYLERNNPLELSEVNVALLRNLFDVVEENVPGLRHVTLHQGGKAYGADLGPFKTPAREDDPRLMFNPRRSPKHADNCQMPVQYRIQLHGSHARAGVRAVSFVRFASLFYPV